MPTIGLIGAGHIGSQVARLAVAAGYDVVISNSRGPETLSGLTKELGPRARAATPIEAASTKPTTALDLDAIIVRPSVEERGGHPIHPTGA